MRSGLGRLSRCGRWSWEQLQGVRVMRGCSCWAGRWSLLPSGPGQGASGKRPTHSLAFPQCQVCQGRHPNKPGESHTGPTQRGSCTHGSEQRECLVGRPHHWSVAGEEVGVGRSGRGRGVGGVVPQGPEMAQAGHPSWSAGWSELWVLIPPERRPHVYPCPDGASSNGLGHPGPPQGFSPKRLPPRGSLLKKYF